jgi:hypothetical protein
MSGELQTITSDKPESAKTAVEKKKENLGANILRFLGAVLIGGAVGTFLGFFCMLIMYLFSKAVMR